MNVVVGGGTVGSATARALISIGHAVHIVDTEPAKVAELRASGLSASVAMTVPADCGVVVLCVQTPSDGHGLDLGFLRTAVNDLAGALRAPGEPVVVAVRSTVLPGTCAGAVRPWLTHGAGGALGRRVAVASMPEFLRQAHAEHDALAPRQVVIGADDPQAAETLVELMAPLGAPVRVMGSCAEAELVKCAHHAYNAKISFWNEMELLARHLGLDGHAVADVVSATAAASWNPAYGIDGGRPYGGACLPKDVLALRGFLTEQGIDPLMVDAIHRRNQTIPDRR